MNRRAGIRQVAFSLCLIVFAVVCRAEDIESSIREAFGLSEDSAVTYEDADGRELSFEEFSKALQDGREMTLTKDANGAATIHLSRPEPRFESASTFQPMDLVALDGTRFRASDRSGRKTFVNFFFAECVPCIEEVPALNEFARKNKDLRVVAVTFDDPATARHFIQQYKFEWPVVAGAQSFISEVGVQTYPTFVLLNSDGTLAGVQSGVPKTSRNNRTTSADIQVLAEGLQKKTD